MSDGSNHTTGKPVVWLLASLIDGGSCSEFCVDVSLLADTVLGKLALNSSAVKKLTPFSYAILMFTIPKITFGFSPISFFCQILFCNF